MLTFTHWASPSNAAFQRIYVRGLPHSGKAFLARPRGRDEAVLTLEPPVAPAQHDVCFQQVVAALQELGLNLPQSKPPTFAAVLDVVLRNAAAPAPSPRRPATADRRARPTYLPESTPSSATLDFSKIAIAPPGLTIYADHREPESIVQLLRSIPNLTVEIESLPVGDFRCGPLIFERKVVSDFELSITDGRLFDEATRIALEPESIGVVIIEGDVMQQGRSLLLQSLQGAVTCLSQVQGLSVLTSPDHVATAYFIAKHVQHCHQGLGYDLPLHRSKPRELVTAKGYLLQALPGVSGQLAATLLEHFGSVGAVMRASRAELLGVRGLGPKTADAILSVLA